MVPMNLRFTNGPFVPHNLISTQESPVPLTKLQVALRIKILTSGPRKKPRCTFSFLSKVTANEPPPSSPTGPLWREILVYMAFCISLENLIKIPLHKKALRKKRSSMLPQNGPPMEAEAHFRSLLTYLSRSLVKESSLKVPFLESLAQKCPVPKALHSSLKVPGIRAPFQIPGSPPL